MKNYSEEVTLRDLYASNALLGLMMMTDNRYHEADLAELAFEIADEMIKVRNAK